MELVLAIVGTAASVLGLVVSIIAWRAAQTAKQVAEKVRAELQRRSARGDVERLLRDTQDMSVYVETQDWFAARRFGLHVLEDISVVGKHYQAQLSPESASLLTLTGKRLKELLAQLQPPISESDVRAAHRHVAEMVEELAMVAGQLKRLEEGGEQYALPNH